MKLHKNECLILRSDNSSGVSMNGFVWPKEGSVEALDWDPTPKCGNGLHGFLGGVGDTLLHRNVNGTFRVVKALLEDVVDLGDKVKFRRGTVVLCTTDPYEAARFMVAAGYSPEQMHFGTATAGYCGIATVGYKGHAIAGDNGVATAGVYGTATAGVYGTATAGDYGTATAGIYGIAIAGSKGTATAGHGGTATAGYEGRAIAGSYGIATAGVGGTLQISNFAYRRLRCAIAYVGEKGIEANVAYRLDKDGNFVKIG